MKLKTTDHFTTIFRLLNARIMTLEHYEQLKNEAEPITLPKKVMTETLNWYFELLEAAKGGDVALITYYYGEKYLKKLNVGTYFRIIKTIESDLIAVRKAFESIKNPPLSSEAQQAGFGSLDFGDYGLVDYICKRQMLTDEQALNTILGFAIIKLKNDAKVAMCEYKMNEIQRVKNKIK